jgi:hypothetical protein
MARNTIITAITPNHPFTVVTTPHAESGDSIAAGVSPDCHGLEEIEMPAGGTPGKGEAMLDSTIVRAHQHSAGAQKSRRRSGNLQKGCCTNVTK